MLSVQKKCDPVMTAYKLVTVDVPYFGWGSSVEKFIAKVGPSATNLTHSGHKEKAELPGRRCQH
jgi:hypothetical protein